MSQDDRTDVLIIEDDPGCTELICDVLRDLGLRTSTVDSVQDALFAIPSKSPRLIILDLMLPDGDGLQVLDAVRADSITARTPVILCTGALFELQASRDLGGDGLTSLLVKPFHIDTFTRLITSLLST